MSNFTLIIILVLLGNICRAQDGNNFPHSPPYTCTTTVCQAGTGPIQERHPMRSSSSRMLQGPPGKQGSPGSGGEKGEKGDPCQCDVADQEEIRELREKMSRLEAAYTDMNELKKKIKVIEAYGAINPADCDEHRAIQNLLGRNVSTNSSTVSIYPLRRYGNLKQFIVDCNDPWIVIQRRMDGSVDFFREWKSYADGFGDVDGEFWIGLTNLHELTTSRNYTLRIDLENWENEKRYAEYSTFRVGDEESNFRLTVSGYSGTARDAMSYHDGMKFSTRGSDNEHDGRDCADKFHGAWWYNGCYHANLNGQYFPSSSGPGRKGVSWQDWLGDNYSLKFVEMKIKAVN